MAGKRPIAMETKTTKRVITVVRLQETCCCRTVIVNSIDVIHPLDGALVAYHHLIHAERTLPTRTSVFVPDASASPAIPCTGSHGFGAATSFSFLLPPPPLRRHP
ncbi:uncharacterized protein BO96DRAFT_486146 [Aspergillus niger CBS 101883]|uniref:uncharacterized protein n=1 Tax=Aspergillus lacticoffeatus (strain CBS 101883) TaxID=1450533 RepID=UPI000D7F9FD9|nr:uncharacterized protein BO96DRAFT_486146 [Aspergillus niger CBS 101883]PYH51780.1 hypothetical protein BO96DRAFT_486146 [Aspergillus niger CBS 101883]